MKVDGLSDLKYLNRFPPNILLAIFFTILVIFSGAMTSIILFTYDNTKRLAELNQIAIEENKKLNLEIIKQTAIVPQQNNRILTFLAQNFNQSFIDGIYRERAIVNHTLNQILLNSRLLSAHINATTDAFGLASHTVPPQVMNGLYAVAATNEMDGTPPMNTELQSLLNTLNQSQQTILKLQEQVQNLSSQATKVQTLENRTQQSLAGSAFPFAENRLQRTDIPENESLTKEPEGGMIASLGRNNNATPRSP